MRVQALFPFLSILLLIPSLGACTIYTRQPVVPQVQMQAPPPAGACVEDTQSIEAGPLWNQNHAEQQCPQVCNAVARSWNGHWRTTVPRRMSVCSCASSCAPAAVVHATTPGVSATVTARPPTVTAATPGVSATVTARPPAVVAAAPFDPTHIVLIHGSQCPAGTRHVTLAEAQQVHAGLCEGLDQWSIVRLANGASMDGPGYQCRMRPNDARELGHSLCTSP